jgi:hypothetical protein
MRSMFHCPSNGEDAQAGAGSRLRVRPHLGRTVHFRPGAIGIKEKPP